MHKALVNGRLEDLKSPATTGGVQDGAHILAGELALPGQGCVVGFPDSGPAKEYKVSCSTQGEK